MGSQAESLASEEGQMQSLAEDLRTGSSSQNIWKTLKAVNAALRGQLTEDDREQLFVQAGGLLTTIRLLRGPATPAANSLASAISAEAGYAVNRLLSGPAGKAGFASDENLIRPMIDALHDAPNIVGRAAAVEGLKWLARIHPAKGKAMAKAGITGVLLAYYTEVKNLDMEEAGAAWDFARDLMRSERIARLDLRRAICGPQADLAFAAIALVHDGLESKDPWTALDEDGIIQALVTALDHESPYCVAAAAPCLSSVYGSSSNGPALLKASRSMSALVRVLERARPPADEVMTILYRRPFLKMELGGEMTLIPNNHPTAMAVAVLAVVLDSAVLLQSFLNSGGVPALVQLLKDSTCPLTAECTSSIIQNLVSSPMAPYLAGPNAQFLADHLLLAGLCPAALQALTVQPRAVRGAVLTMLFYFFSALEPEDSHPAAMAQLVAGNVVELTVAYMTEAGLDIPVFGLDVFIFFGRDPRAQKRLCDPAVADQLIKWTAKWLPQADWPDLIRMDANLRAFLHMCPLAIPAAVEANLTPGLVRAVSNFRRRPLGYTKRLVCALEHPLVCLTEFLFSDLDSSRGVWKAAMNAGIVPLFIDLFTLRHAWTTVLVVEASGLLLMAAPKGEVLSSGVRLLRAIAQLLNATPVAAARAAAEMLYVVGLVHPELCLDIDLWGIEDAVRRLTMHSDPGTAAAARQLKNHFFHHHAPDSPNQPTRPNLSTALTPHPNPRGSGSHHIPKGRVCEFHTKELGLSEAPVPKSPGGWIHRLGANPGRCAAHVVWACGGCGIEAIIFSKYLPDEALLDKGKLKACSACGSVWYCGKGCQKAHWPAHKATCKRLAGVSP